MLKPISLLVGALMLTSTTLAPAKADADKTITVLTITEADKPTVMVNMPSGKLTLRGDTVIHDAPKNALTQTTIIKGNVEVISIDKEGKQTSYKVKNGVAVLTSTLVKASATPTSKAVKKSKA